VTKEDIEPTDVGSEVLTKPLPKVLDELEGHIKATEEAKRASESANLAQRVAV
jgi:hypothetical protein